MQILANYFAELTSGTGMVGGGDLMKDLEHVRCNSIGGDLKRTFDKCPTWRNLGSFNLSLLLSIAPSQPGVCNNIKYGSQFKLTEIHPTKLVFKLNVQATGARWPILNVHNRSANIVTKVT
ncbi:MAG: hypothetical protein IPI68_12775 [Chitinophagaceae bacterium]|nr:hypothetical protein [Chitinophagaceae bacterium]